MAKYHMNPETGKVGVCKAQSASTCKFSLSEDEHVIADNSEQAEKMYEIKVADRKDNNAFSNSSKKQRLDLNTTYSAKDLKDMKVSQLNTLKKNTEKRINERIAENKILNSELKNFRAEIADRAINGMSSNDEVVNKARENTEKLKANKKEAQKDNRFLNLISEEQSERNSARLAKRKTVATKPVYTPPVYSSCGGGHC